MQVTFKNLASRPFSFHSTLQAYEETQDATQGGEVVWPGELRKYSWKVLPQMAPITEEFDCKAWAYFSNVDLVGGSLSKMHPRKERQASPGFEVKAFPVVLC